MAKITTENISLYNRHILTTAENKHVNTNIALE